MPITLKSSCKYLNLIRLTYHSNAMEEHRKTCQMEGRYVEADLAKTRIGELRGQEYTRTMEEMVFKH
jgi:hypothetical protein